MSLTGLAVRKSRAVMVLGVFIVVAGGVSYVTLPREAAPDVKIPYMIVTTVYPGVAPEDIEGLVTRRIEQELKSLKDVKEITSSSAESVSSIAIEFEPEVDLDYALQRVKDKIDAARPDLPAEVEEPVVTEIDFENMPILNVILTADYDLVRLKPVADAFADEFETIAGVLEARVDGALEREVQIQVDPARLAKYNLSPFDVASAVQAEHVSIPGGTIDIGSSTYTVRVPGELRDPYGFGALVVTAGPEGPVYVRDVADVEFGFEERQTISRYNGRPCITIGVTKRAGENIIRIADEVKRIIAARQPALPRGTEVTIQGDVSKWIRIMILDLENNIYSGFVLVALCIFAFLGLRNSLFVASAIPLSMLITFAVLQLAGVTLNFIVLFSLIMALGMLVDNAVVIVENIYRHRSLGKGPIEAAVSATDEVAAPVVASTLTTVAAFVPMLFWPGIMGEFMKYLPITLITVLGASLFVALVINPVLCARFMRVRPGDQERFTGGSGWYYRVVLAAYERVLRLAAGRPATTLGLAAAALVLSLAAYGLFGHGVEFMPQTDPDSMWITIEGPTAQRLEATDAMAAQLEQAVAAMPDVTGIVANVGVSASASGLGVGMASANEARIYLDLKDFAERQQPSLRTYEQWADRVKFITGAAVELHKEENGPPVGEPVEIQLSGDDYLTLGRLAQEVRGLVQDVPGLIDLRDDFESSKPELAVRVDREKAAVLGLNTRDVAQAVRTAVSGLDAGDFRVGEEEYDITVRFAPRFRQSLADLDRIFIAHEGRQIPLSAVAEYGTAAGFGTIRRADLKRVVTITGKNHGRLASEVLAEVRARLRNHPLPPGYGLRYRGQDEEQNKAARFLLQALAVALFAIALIIVAQFDSLKVMLIIMASVVLSTIGGLWGLLINGMPFGVIMTGIGIISLAGVVVNNAIVLLDYTGKLRERGLPKFEAVVEAGRTRFRPVILTALTTVVGIIPLGVGWSFDFYSLRFAAGGSSAQWWAPMAVVIIYGLSLATVLTLVVVPSMYMLLGPGDEAFEQRRTGASADLL